MKKMQEENDHLKETLEKMKTSASDLNERETTWTREIRQLTFDLQRASGDARELNMQLTTLRAKVSRGRHKDRTGRGGVGHMQARLGEMLHQSRSEYEGGEVSAIPNDGTRKQVPGRRSETVEGDGTGCASSTRL